MNSLAALWIEPWMQRLGWVLIHFIWQGAAIALFLALTLRLLARTSSHVRYAIIGGALLLCGIMPVVTWASLGSQSEPSVPPATASTPVYAPDIKAPAISDSFSFPDKILWSPSETATGWRDNFRQVADVALPYVVGLWFSGVLISITRLTLGWAFIWRLCRSGLPIRDSICLERFRNLLVRMQVGVPVRLLESALVEVPMLIGWLRPTILVPASVLIGLTPDQLDAVLVHELAHVRRYDYLVNLLQTVIETILFYHPAVWWISRKLREERENCCDDVALEVMQDRIVYLSALAQLEEGRVLPLALSASGGSLLQRIKRIAGVERRKSSLMPVIILTFIVGVLGVPLIGQMATTTVKITGDVSKSKDPALTKTLVAAAKQGDLAKVEPLLKQGADPNAMLNSEGMNALLAAVHGDHIDVVRLLLQSGADPNCKSSDTDLFALSYTKNAAMVKVLLDAGADPNGKCGRITPLMDAPDPESVRLLVQHGAKLNPKFSDGRSLLENAVGNELYERSLGDRWDVIAELIKQGAEFDPKGNGPTLLVLAAMEGKTNIARGLLDAGVSPDASATRGIFVLSPLTEAAFARSPDMIRLLLSRGAHVSAWRGNTSPLSAALNSGRYNNANVLRQAGENDVGYFSEYCARGDSAKVNELLKAGANVNETDNFGVTPLMYAIRQGHPEIVRMLFEHGANINQFNSAGTTPYSLFQDLSADFKRYPGAVQDDWGIPGSVHADEAKRRMAGLESFFKQHPSDPNYQDASGRTALHQAALAGNTGELNQLLALRPDINAKDNNGNTPLLLAASSPLASNLATRYVDEASAKEWNAEARIADQLIKAGAKLDLLMTDGKTVGEAAMAAAIKAKNPQLISVLREAGVAETVSPPQSPAEATGTKVADAGTLANAQMVEAVKKGDAKTLQMLIHQGVDPKAVKSADRPTLLFYAGSPEVAEILIAHGIDPKVADVRGYTALHSVCESGEKNAAAIARVLLQHGADPNSRAGELKTTPLMDCRDGATVDVLVEYGADLKARDNGGQSLDSQGVLFSSVFWTNDISRFQALLRHGVPFDPQRDGPTLLMYCAQNTNVLLAKWLLEHGVDPNLKGTWDKRSNFQATPLHTAVADGGRIVQLPGHDDEEAMVKLLLAHGAKVTDEMVSALRNNRPILVKLFWDSGRRDISELSYRISQGATASDVQKLLDQGMPADPTQDRYVTPLNVAAGLGRMDLVKLLVEHRADVNKGNPINPQYPQNRPDSLSAAALTGQDEIVDYLLQQGATPTPEALLYAATNSFFVPIPGRRSQDHFEHCVKLLIDAGALKGATPEEDGRILSAAMLTGGEGGNPAVLKMLLDAGLTPELPMPSTAGEKQVSVLTYYQDFYAKKQNYYRFIGKLKVLLGLLEQAHGGSAPR